MKFGIIVFPGSNCDDDMVWAIGEVMGQKVVKLWHKDRDLQNCDVIILPGGFSYGDYLRCGAIARFSPIMEEVISFAKKGGYVWGICNGFQILTEAGLLPGALLENYNQKYICKNVFLKTQTTDSLITRALKPEQVIKIPIAHGEGRYYASTDVLDELQDNDQILFRYCNAFGEVTEEANPNGSLLNIAGICNKERNVLGMMPHPERAIHRFLGNTDGAKLVESVLAIL